MKVSLPDYLALSAKVAIWAGGAITTFLLALASSKIRVYHDARTKHQDELKQQVLEPLRSSLQEQYGMPQFSTKWGSQQYDPDASAQELPIKYGLVLAMSRSGHTPVEEALWEDARNNHYQSLLAAWETFTSSWSAHVTAHVHWIEDMAKRVLEESGLPAHPAEEPGAYVMHLDFALFVYRRLFRAGLTNLALRLEGNAVLVMEDNRALAKGTEEQTRHLLKLVDDMREQELSRGKELQTQFEQLQNERASLSRRFSLAIAAKKLKGRCPLVNFL